jgi:hypothetical protein
METFSHCEKCKLKLHNRRKCPICHIPVVYDFKELKEPLRHASDYPVDFGAGSYDLCTEMKLIHRLKQVRN